MNNLARTATAGVAAALIVLVGAQPAQAIDVDYQIEFDAPASVSVEYGQYWNLPMTAENGGFWIEIVNQQPEAVITITGNAGAYKPDFYFYAAAGGLTSAYGTSPLGVGSYEFSVSGTHTYSYGDTYTGATTAPGKVTVTKAKLGVELRVLASASNSTGAIVTAKFTGRFAEEYQSSFFPGAAVSPAGTWAITIKDAAGETAIQQSIERAAGDDVLATSFYWPDAEPGEQYTATAEFTPTGTSAANFTVTAAQPFSYTAPAELRPTPTSTATARPDASLPEPTGFGIPLWALITLIALILGLGALVTILSVRLNRQRTPNSGEVSE